MVQDKLKQTFNKPFRKQYQQKLEPDRLGCKTLQEIFAFLNAKEQGIELAGGMP